MKRLFAALAFCVLGFAAISQDVVNTYVGLATQVADGILTNAKLTSMGNSTVKCRTTAGTGAPEDCTAAQAAAIVGSVGGALRASTSIFTRDMTAASGPQSITDAGFTPISLTIVCGIDGSLSGSWAFATASAATSNRLRTGLFSGTSSGLVIATTSTDFQTATVAMTATGFDLTWTKTGLPTGTAACNYLAQR